MIVYLFNHLFLKRVLSLLVISNKIRNKYKNYFIITFFDYNCIDSPMENIELSNPIEYLNKYDLYSYIDKKEDHENIQANIVGFLLKVKELINDILAYDLYVIFHSDMENNFHYSTLHEADDILKNIETLNKPKDLSCYYYGSSKYLKLSFAKLLKYTKIYINNTFDLFYEGNIKDILDNEIYESITNGDFCKFDDFCKNFCLSLLFSSETFSSNDSLMKILERVVISYISVTKNLPDINYAGVDENSLPIIEKKLNSLCILTSPIYNLPNNPLYYLIDECKFCIRWERLYMDTNYPCSIFERFKDS